jgi:hypothetical protein
VAAGGRTDPFGWEAFPGGNAYVWVTLAVLVILTQQVHVDARRRSALPLEQGPSAELRG